MCKYIELFLWKSYHFFGVIILISALSAWITSIFVSLNVINEDDTKVYRYGFELLISTVLNGIILLIIALISDTFFPCLCFVIAFIIVRRTAGGYHSKTHLGCCATLCIIMCTFVFIIKNLPMKFAFWFSAAFSFLSAIIILLCAPAEHPNQPLSPEKKKRLRKKCTIYLALLISLVCILSVLDCAVLAFSFASGFFTASCSCVVLKTSTLKHFGTQK